MIVTASPSPHTQKINRTKNSLTFSSGFIFISTMHGFPPAVKWLMCKSFGGYTSAGDNFSLQNFSLKRFFLPWHIQYIQSQTQILIQIYTNHKYTSAGDNFPPPPRKKKLFLEALLPVLTYTIYTQSQTQIQIYTITNTLPTATTSPLQNFSFERFCLPWQLLF